MIVGGFSWRRAVEDIERLRRSMAMLSPGQPAGLSREDAIDLLAELKATAGELARLQRGLRALLEGDDLAVSHSPTSNTGSGIASGLSPKQ